MPDATPPAASLAAVLTTGRPVPVYASNDVIPAAATWGSDRDGYRTQLELTVVFDGGGQVEVGPFKGPLAAGSCLLIHHDQPKRLTYAAGTHRAKVAFRCLDQQGADLLPDRLEPPQLFRTLVDTDLLRLLMERVAGYFATIDNRPLYRTPPDLDSYRPGLERAICQLRAILYEIEQQQVRLVHAPAIRHYRAVHLLCQQIRRDPLADDPVPVLAGRLGLSTQQFTRVFRAVAGASPAAFVLRERIRLAAQLLTDTSLDVTVIAQRLGYASVAAFCHQFRKHRGTTPLAFRRLIHNIGIHDRDRGA